MSSTRIVPCGRNPSDLFFGTLRDNWRRRRRYVRNYTRTRRSDLKFRLYGPRTPRPALCAWCSGKYEKGMKPARCAKMVISNALTCYGESDRSHIEETASGDILGLQPRHRWRRSTSEDDEVHRHSRLRATNNRCIHLKIREAKTAFAPRTGTAHEEAQYRCWSSLPTAF